MSVTKIVGWMAFVIGISMTLAIIALIVAMETGLYVAPHAGWVVLIPFAGVLAYMLTITPIAMRYDWGLYLP